MSYENAPATKLLATHCAVCVRPLVDAVSVNFGMGPDCRKKYYNDSEGDIANRPAANKLVYFIAAKQTGADVAAAVEQVRSLGFAKLADILTKRLAKVQITVEGDRLAVRAPYNEVAVPLMAKVPGRRWDKERKVNTYPRTSRGALWDTLKQAFPDVLAHGPSGFFIVGGPAIPKQGLVAKDAAPATPAAQPKPGYGLDKAEREVQEMEAKVDREQTIRDEENKREARKAAEEDSDDKRCKVCNTTYWQEYKAGRGGQWMVSDLNQCCGPCWNALDDAEKDPIKGSLEEVRQRFSR